MALRGLLLDRGIELPQERDMVVRVIDVASLDHKQACVRTIDAACGPDKPPEVYLTLCA